MITIENSLHGTNRELLDVNVGDTISAHWAAQVAIELCGISGCDQCGRLGENGPQNGFIAVELDGGAVFISPTGDDFEGIPNHCQHRENAAESITGGQNFGGNTKSTETQPAEPNPVSEALKRLLELRQVVNTLPSHLSAWLGNAIDQYLSGAEALDHCLMLSLPVSGTVPANAMHQREIRNANLTEAATLLEPGQSAWRQAGALMTAITKFDLGELPHGRVHNHIKIAYTTGVRIPSSRVGLSDVLARK